MHVTKYNIYTMSNKNTKYMRLICLFQINTSQARIPSKFASNNSHTHKKNVVNFYACVVKWVEIYYNHIIFTAKDFLFTVILWNDVWLSSARNTLHLCVGVCKHFSCEDPIQYDSNSLYIRICARRRNHFRIASKRFVTI